jgi:hypothetical protein
VGENATVLFYCNDDVKKTLPSSGNKAVTATAKIEQN